MSPERFEHLLSLVGPIIQKKDTQLRESISADQCLVITIRFLSSGDAQQSLCYSFHLGKSTISGIISETCELLIRVIDQETGILPYFLVGDEIFPLKTWLMRPYPGTDLSCEEKKIYNYRHSRARRVIERSEF